jgi:hypothetical protein
MGNSNKDNDRSISITLYSKLRVTKYDQDCSRSTSLEISKKYSLLHILRNLKCDCLKDWD